MKAIIVHGWGADSGSNWFPWLKRELEKLGIETVCPDMPDPHYPMKQEWMDELRTIVPSFAEKDEIILIGHSLGGPAILRLLETFGKGEKARAAILVSGFTGDIGIPQILNFTEGAFDFAKIKKAASEFYIINSDNDPYVPISEGEHLAIELGTRLIVEPGAGHINSGDGYLRYGRLLKLIKKIAGKA